MIDVFGSMILQMIMFAWRSLFTHVFSTHSDVISLKLFDLQIFSSGLLFIIGIAFIDRTNCTIEAMQQLQSVSKAMTL